MTAPVRLQLSRRAGFNLQALSLATNGLTAVKVTRPGAWKNPFKVGEDHSYYGGPEFEHASAEQCVSLFRRFLDVQRPPYELLRGRNLACWCKPGAPCHADVLLEIANRPICEGLT